MNIYFFLNRCDELNATQTTTLLIANAVKSGHKVFLFDLESLVYADPHELQVQCLAIDTDDPQAVTRAHNHGPTMIKNIGQDDRILIRTSPGRDTARIQAHLAWLDIFSALHKSGFHIENKPDVLRQLISKSYMLTDLGQFMPRGYLSSFETPRSTPPYVVKPLYGSRGYGIELIAGSDQVAKQPRDQIYCVQEFVQEPEEHRVLILNGELLYQDKQIAAYCKKASAGEFRNNLAQGATAIRERLVAGQIRVLEEIATWCKRAQITFAGADLKADKLIELNVFSPGGFDAIKRTCNHDFCEPVYQALIQ